MIWHNAVVHPPKKNQSQKKRASPILSINSHKPPKSLISTAADWKMFLHFAAATPPMQPYSVPMKVSPPSPTAGHETEGVTSVVDICRSHTQTPTSCLRPGPTGIEDVATLVSLATRPVRESVRLNLWPPSVVPVLSAESELVLIGGGVTVAWLATVGVGVDQYPEVGK